MLFPKNVVIFKMPVLNSNHNVSARPDLDTHQLQILTPTTFNCVRKHNLYFRRVLEDGILGKYLVITPQKSLIEIFQFSIEIFSCLKKYFSRKYLSK